MTGRANKDPALQNIPIRTELGRELRRLFMPKESVLESVDCSELENRLAEQLKKEGKGPYG